MFKKLLHMALLYRVQFRENRTMKKYEKKKKIIAERLEKAKKQQLNTWLKANRAVTKE